MWHGLPGEWTRGIMGRMPMPRGRNGDRSNSVGHDGCFVVQCDACVTPKALHNIAQGRAAHRRVNGPNRVLTLKELHRWPESSVTVLYNLRGSPNKRGDLDSWGSHTRLYDDAAPRLQSRNISTRKPTAVQILTGTTGQSRTGPSVPSIASFAPMGSVPTSPVAFRRRLKRLPRYPNVG